MGITQAQLPDNSIWLTYAFCVAMQVVNQAIQCASPLLYLLAVNNLAGSNLLNYAQDVTPVVPYPPNDANSIANGIGFFAYTRAQYNMLGFVSGVISAAADESTSEAMVVPESFKNWTMANLQQAKDPYGRAYLGIAGDYGDAPWALA